MSDLELLEQVVIKRFEWLCEKVRTDPSLGNSSKGKKDNFLDGAETILTEVQYQVAELKKKH